MTTRTSYDLTDFKIVVSDWGGYSPRTSDEFAPDDKTIIDGQNMALEYPVGSTAKTIITTRLGFTELGTLTGSTDKIQGLKVWKIDSESNYRIMAASAGRLYEGTFSTFAGTVTLTWTTKTCHITNRVRMVQFNNKLYIVDGSNRIKQYTGTVWSDLTDGMLTTDDPRPSLIFVHKNRLWINSTTATQQNYVWWSELNYGDKWTVNPAGGHDAGVQPVKGYPDESSPITAFGVYTGSFVIHQAGRIFLFITTGAPYPVSGTDVQWQLKELVIERGALSQDSVVDLGEKLLYRTTRGVHELSGIQALQSSTTTIDTINAKPISYDVEPVLFGLDATAEASVFFKFYYILNLKKPGSLTNDTALVYDTRRNCWYTPWTNYKFSCFDTANINGQEVCFAGSDVDNTIYTIFTSATDAGTPIEGNFVTKAFDNNKPDHTKTFRRCAFNPSTTDNNGVYVSYRLDYGPWIELAPEFRGRSLSSHPLGQFILGADVLGNGVMQKLVQRFFSIGRRARHCSIRFSNNNLTNTGNKKPFGIEMMTLRSYLEDEDQRNYA